MANMLFANNANTTLASSLTNVATTMSVTSATSFPSPAGSQYFYCTLADAATQTTIEIVKVTAVSGTTFTIVRGQDGTTGTAFAAGDVVSLRLVRASLNDFPKLDETNTFSQTQTFSQTIVGSINGNAATATNLAGGSSYAVPYQTGSNTTSFLAAGTSGSVLMTLGSATAPIWVLASTLSVSSATTAGNVTGTVAVANGGTGLTSLTVGYIPFGNGTSAFSSSSALTFDGTNISVAGSASAASFIPSSATIPTNGLYLPATNSLAFSTNSTRALYIDSSQNVGIGTSSPANKLNLYDSTNAVILVQGDLAASITSARYSADAFSSSLAMRKSRGTVASPAAPNSGDTVGIINYQVFGGTNLRNIAQITGVVDTYTSDTNISGYLTFQTSSSGSAAVTEKMRLFASGGLSLGNTADPGAGNLSVFGTINTKGYTVATLPTGVTGARAYVTNALAPTFGSTVAGGGTVTIPVFYNGSNWIVG